ncbi:MAG: MFS transporter, partial [Nocardioidaceae bacterium]|nr:MFS transporter [Nocardioidaceae bacterium]
LTLTAVHGVGDDDSGIGSGVLNAMQQVGGSLGLAILSTVAINAAADKGREIGAAVQSISAQATQPATEAEQTALTEAIGQVAFAHGSTYAFIVGAAMIWVGALLAFLFLNVKHEEINDAPAAPAAV